MLSLLEGQGLYESRSANQVVSQTRCSRNPPPRHCARRSAVLSDHDDLGLLCIPHPLDEYVEEMKSPRGRGDLPSYSTRRSRSPPPRDRRRDISPRNTERSQQLTRGRSRSRSRECSPQSRRGFEKTGLRSRSRSHSRSRRDRHRADNRSKSRSRERKRRRSRSISSAPSLEESDGERRQHKTDRKGRSRSRSRERSKKERKKDKKEKRSKKEKKVRNYHLLSTVSQRLLAEEDCCCRRTVGQIRNHQ
jgi:hypothetical protein